VLILIQGVEWILAHMHFTCNSENPLILAPLIIFQQNLKHKSCRVKKKVPKSFSNYFLTPSGSVRQEKSTDKIVIAMTPDNNKVHFLTNVTSLLIPQRRTLLTKNKKLTS
jgi:hypothetical protein